MDLRSYKPFYRYLGVLVVLLLATMVPVWAQDAPVPPQAAGDNSKVNQQDRSAAAPTADQQKNNKADLELTREIRRALTKDKSLSTYAHNVKIISQSGKVTLKGPVRSDDKNAVLAKASQVAGQGNVNDEMSVVPKHD